MIKTYENIEDSGQINLKTGDKLRLPLKMDWANSCQSLTFFMQRVEKVDCKPRVREVAFADIVDFKCVSQGRFKIRVRDFDSTGTKQFAVYLGGKKLGRGFRSAASNLKDYVEKIRAHFSKLKGWEVTAQGNIIHFWQKSNCVSCGDDVEIKLGDYAILNQNKPCITTEYIGIESVEGTKCYNLRISNIMPGNVITVGGRPYVVGARDTAETMRTKILDGKDLYCLRISEALTYSSDAGHRTVANTNSPTLTASLMSSDANYDYYLIRAFDVREGNVFTVNGVQKIASNVDTSGSIESFYNNTSGLFRVAKGTGIDPNAISGSRNTENSSVATVSFSLYSEIPTANKKKYTAAICEDVKGGNMYTFDGRVYIAKQGDTNLEVAYGLVGANNPVFTYYLDEERELETYAEPGNRTDEQQMASVESISKVVDCCSKDSMILEFDAKEAGLYYAEFRNDSGSLIRFSDRIVVDDLEEGELVEFNNPSNAFGMDGDGEEWFSVRLPVFLHPKTYPTYEEVHENTKGEQVRSVTRIGVQRELTTHLVDDEGHENIIKALKSKNVRIGGVGYTFIGEYNLPPQKNGKYGKRSATGVIKENGLVYSMEGC